MEFVYVVKRYDLFDLEFPHGFHEGKEDGALSKYLSRILEKGFFIERGVSEKDSSFKQIIPYSILCHDNRVLLLKRTASQGESRLHNKLSIGVGGHINPVDQDENILIKACIREIEEEIIVEEAFEPVPLGIINDESNPVGSVHFGMVFLVRLSQGSVRVRETAMMSAEFVEIDELRKMVQRPEYNFETWSSLIIQSSIFLSLG